MKNTFIFFIIIFLSCPALTISAEDSAAKQTHWDNGKVRTEKYYDALDNLVEEKYYREDGTLEQIIKFDAQGHTIDEAYYYNAGTLRQCPGDNWARRTSRYVGGVMRQASYYDVNNQLTERDFFDASGNYVDHQYFGNSRARSQEDFAPDLEQFASPQQELDSRLKLGVEQNQYFDDQGELNDQTTTVVD